MAAGSWKDWAQGELVTESGFQDIQDSVVFIYASEAAANAALTNKVEGTIFYDTTADVLKAWDGSAWISAETGDLEGLIAGTNLNGGGTSGTVTINLDSTLTGIADVQDSGNTSLVGRKNYIINGNFDIWQRGTSLTGASAKKFLADRWQFEGSGAIYNLSQGTFTAGQTDVPNNPKYYLDITVTSADDLSRLEQNIEDVYTLAGEKVTVSFWAKYTTTAPTNFDVYLVQKFGSGGSADVSKTVLSGQTLTTSWQKFTGTVTLNSISGKTVGAGSSLMLRGPWNPNNETYDIQIAQVQVEKGSVATDFEYRPIGEELNLCARYYQKLISPRVNFNMDTAGIADSTSLLYVNIPLKNEMRIDSDGTVGTVTKSGNMAINDFSSNGDNLSGTPVSFFRLSNSQLSLGLVKATADLTTNNHYRLSLANDAYFDIDVEL